MAQVVKVKSVEHLTHDVLKIVTEKPAGITYQPGQAADISINKAGWDKEIRTFTFVSQEEDDHLEFNIKTYPSHKGVTNELLSLHAGDELIIGDVYGDIRYKGEGIFLAGGAGITPFIAILQYLKRKDKIGNNKLIFANKTKGDIIRENEFRTLLGDHFINILSAEKIPGYEHGLMDAGFIKRNMDAHTKYFYLCGPPPMMDAVEKHLASLGVNPEFIVREGF